ncbi:MAG: sigma-70 family RNA polymerase sigma factor [Acidobacteriota bacterium]|nr:MAG: sigma-70 family RNA polymerase sigma factor [Acidobacteriota bacterium]
MTTSNTNEFESSRFSRADADLVARCRRGDQSAWDEIVDKYQRLIYAVPMRAGLSEEQAADVFQEVFLTLFNKIDEIEQPELLRSWIVTTAKFKTWGIIRGQKGKYPPADEDEMENEMANLKDSAPLQDEMLIELEQQHLIRRALATLEEKCRKMLSLLYLREPAASYAEVGKAIGVGETSISPLRSRCLKKLEKILRR